MVDRKIIELEDGWQLISSGIKKIENILEGKFEDPLDAVQWAVLYTTIYNMSTQKYPHNYSQQLYDRYKESLEEYINSIVLSSLREKYDDFMLRELVRRWDNYKIMVRWLSRFFSYLDRFFIPQSSLSGLNTVGLKCFRDLVYEEVKANVRDVVIALIHRERGGEQVDRYLLKNGLGIFVEIGMGSMDCYESDFEKALLEDTAAYYSRKASSWILEDTCPDYMLKAEECLKREKERVDHCLHADSEQKLLEVVQHELLSQYEIKLLEKEDSGVHSLLRDNKEEDLRRMYRLFHKIPEGLEPVARIFKQHVTDEGTRIVIKAENEASNRKAEKKVTDGALEQEFMSEIIELYKKFMHYVSMCFGDHTIFHKAQKEAFEVFCNKGVAGSTNAELLATFCDYILRKGGSEKLSDEAIEDILEKAVKILAFISEKDLFGEFYRKKIAQRLLFDKGVNLDLERSIITKLKEQCGGQFTSKIEGMVRDLTLAKENQTNFGNYIDSHDNEHISLGIDLSVTVLTTGLWPSYKSLHLNLPTEMVKCIELYREFYQTKNNHKKLTWIYSLGQCNLTGKFSKKTIDITVTTYQAAALLLFNSSETLSYAEIKSQLNLTDEDTVRMLHSLSCAKYKILEKQPATKKVTESDCFKFNANFTDIKRRIKVSLPPVDEKNKVIEGVESNRRYAIEAAIVRIMKSRKVVYHSQLITECVEKLAQLFKPSIKDIKKGIEDLITRAYMERDEANPAMYIYLA